MTQAADRWAAASGTARNGHVPRPLAVFFEPLQHFRNRLHLPSILRLPKLVERIQVFGLRAAESPKRRVFRELFVTDRTVGVRRQPRPLEPCSRQVVQHVVHVPSDRLHGTPPRRSLAQPIGQQTLAMFVRGDRRVGVEGVLDGVRQRDFFQDRAPLVPKLWRAPGSTTTTSPGLQLRTWPSRLIQTSP